MIIGGKSKLFLLGCLQNVWEFPLFSLNYKEVSIGAFFGVYFTKKKKKNSCPKPE